MRGLHDLLKVRPSSLFILCGWISNTVEKLVHVAGFDKENFGVLEFYELIIG